MLVSARGSYGQMTKRLWDRGRYRRDFFELGCCRYFAESEVFGRFFNDKWAVGREVLLSFLAGHLDAITGFNGGDFTAEKVRLLVALVEKGEAVGGRRGAACDGGGFTDKIDDSDDHDYGAGYDSNDGPDHGILEGVRFGGPRREEESKTDKEHGDMTTHR
jgi:hypothetical protein